MTDEERTETFVGRETIVQELVGIIEHQPEGAGVQHAILIGPRGIGKTSILLTLRNKLAGSAVMDKWQMVIFPEESYGIYDLADFWIEVLKLLAEQSRYSSFLKSIGKLQKDFSDRDDPAEAAIALIKDWCAKNKKRLLLFAENFDMILSQIHDSRQDARLRNLLMNDGTLMIIGTGISFFEQTRSYDKPFYNFFRIIDIDNLSFEQSRSLLLKRAAFDKIEKFEDKFGDGKLRSLQYFTGGNPRLLLMLYHAIAGSPPEEIRLGLEKLLDEVTPYYKNKTEILPPQQRKILDHLARTGAETREGVSPTDIAKTTRMKPNIVSSQLKRLSSQGYVRAANIRGRSSYYSLSEPLYSIWYQMRFGRETQRHMEWLVNFLKNWYDEPEINDELIRIREERIKYVKSDEVVAIDPDGKEAWAGRTRAFLLLITQEIAVSPESWKMKAHFEEALKSRPIIGPEAWDKLALPILLPLISSKNAELLLQLFSVPELEQEFFPLIRALEFFKIRDRDLIEKLSPEYQGIVLEIIEKYDNQQKPEEPETIDDKASQT